MDVKSVMYQIKELNETANRIRNAIDKADPKSHKAEITIEFRDASQFITLIGHKIEELESMEVKESKK